MELATAFPGNTGVRPEQRRAAGRDPAPERLQHGRLRQVSRDARRGKRRSPGRSTAGRRGSGFDKFYGFIGGETNQWAPAIYDGVTRVEAPHDPNYHFTTDMTNQAIAWMRFQQALTPDKPFYMYFATGATHAPHHAPKEYIAKYKGKFDQGWDKLREETLARQIELGVVPAGTKLTARPAEIPAWDSLLGRPEAAVRAADGDVRGLRRAHRSRGRPAGRGARGHGRARQHAVLLHRGRQRLERRGRPGRQLQRDPRPQRHRQRRHRRSCRTSTSGAGPSTFPHFSIGWAHAGNTPFQWTKQVASHFGGTRNPHGRPLAQAASRPRARSARSSTT